MELNMKLTEFGEMPSPEVREGRIDDFKRIFDNVYQTIKDEHPALIVSVCLTMALNLTIPAKKENILATLDAIENMKVTLENELEKEDGV